MPSIPSLPLVGLSSD
jgi:hypothetical protein